MEKKINVSYINMTFDRKKNVIYDNNLYAVFESPILASHCCRDGGNI